MDGARICHAAEVERSGQQDLAPSIRGRGGDKYWEGGKGGQEDIIVSELPGRPPTHGTTWFILEFVFWNFGSQFIAKLESKIDAESGSGVELMLKKEGPRLSEFPGLVARRWIRGEVDLSPGGRRFGKK